MIDPESRRAILDRVEAMLDQLDAGAVPPEGIDMAILEEDGATPDLYTLLAQMTALTREVQLQGRAANRMSSEVAQLVQQVSESTGQVAARTAVARRDAQAELLGDLLDVRDRIARGLDDARKRLDSFLGFFARIGSRAVVEAIVRGNELALERIDEILRRYGVHEVARAGQPYDPDVMRAVETEARADVAPGTVTEVVRRGWRTAERMLRHAEVRVSAEEKRS
jgi:molecular chaperone GrpE (heat shock protein)